MSDMNLFESIQYAKPEDISTEILVFLMSEEPIFRKKILELLSSKVSEHPEKAAIDSQWVTEKGRPDIIISTEDEFIIIENKPWPTSSFTTKDEAEDQFKRYASKLASEKHSIKRLCLLTIGRKEKEFKSVIARVEGIKPSEIVDYYKDKGIECSFLHWETVLSELDNLLKSNPEVDIYRVLIRELRKYVLKPWNDVIDANVVSFMDNWSQLRDVVIGANEKLKLRCPSIRTEFAKNFGSYGIQFVREDDGPRVHLEYKYHLFDWRSDLWGHFSWGASLIFYRKWVQIHKQDQPLVHPFFFTITEAKNSFIKHLKNQCLSGESQLLLDCGFTQCNFSWAPDVVFFIKPLNLEGKINDLKDQPEELVTAVVSIINELTDAIKKRFEYESKKQI